MKKVICLAISFILGISMLGIPYIGAAGADLIEGPAAPPAGVVPNSVSVSPEENCFQIAGSDRTFVLLEDNAEDTNSAFYVITRDKYGSRYFDTAPGAGQPYDASTNPQSGQKFDPASKTNIAYWLNNDFLTDGNTQGNSGGSLTKLPQQIIDHINTNHVWRTECGDSMTNCSEALVGAKYYDVTCGVSLMSLYEFQKYAGKFGAMDGFRSNVESGNGSWEGWWLRTCGRDGRQIMRHNNNVPGSISTWNNGASSYNDLGVRPQFWLSKSFFKTVKLNLDSLGANVIEAIKRSYTRADLSSAGYTLDDLDYIFGASAEEPIDVAGPVNIAKNTPIENYQNNTPPENCFKVGDNTFILLDDDKNSESSRFYVMAKEMYGGRNFNTKNETTGQIRISWKFDPTNVDNMAYWLNDKENGFLKNGNSFGRNDIAKLPDEIIKAIDTQHVWYTECGDDNTDCSMAACRNKPYYRTVCGVTVPSYYEFNKYKDKIGVNDNMWQSHPDGFGSHYGWALRTSAPVTDSEAYLYYVGSNPNSWTGPSVGQIRQFRVNSDSAGVAVGIRPQFWLNKSFFLNYKLDLEATGSNVIQALGENYGREELKAAGYSNDELKTIFGTDLKLTYSGFVDGNGQEVPQLVADADITGKLLVRNNTGSEKKADLIVACYNAENTLVNVALASYTIPAAAVDMPLTATIKLPSDLMGAYVKMYLWENPLTMRPFCQGIDFVPVTTP